MCANSRSACALNRGQSTVHHFDIQIGCAEADGVALSLDQDIGEDGYRVSALPTDCAWLIAFNNVLRSMLTFMAMLLTASGAGRLAEPLRKSILISLLTGLESRSRSGRFSPAKRVN